MNISAGLAGLKAAADLTKSMRDAAKAGTLKPDEFAGRVGEIYDYIIDSKAALVDTQEENIRLREELRSLREDSEERNAIKGELVAEDNAYFRIADATKTGPYCTACWDNGDRLVRLTNSGLRSLPGLGWKHVYVCALHPKHEVPMSKDYAKATS
jgi:regulator of replication initiation timing